MTSAEPGKHNDHTNFCQDFFLDAKRSPILLFFFIQRRVIKQDVATIENLGSLMIAYDHWV
jgi:hypothetical protein